jgi:hypothetical protein
MQETITIALPGLPAQCSACSAEPGAWPLAVYGGRLNVTCPACFVIVAPVTATARSES